MKPRPSRYKRLSELFQSMALAVQLLFLFRIVLLASGEWHYGLSLRFVRMTDVFVRPFEQYASPISIGWYTLDIVSAYIVILSPILFALLAFVADMARLHRKNAREIEPLFVT